MYAQVMRDQFQITEEVIVHEPTGAEFTPTLSYANLLLFGREKSARGCPAVRATVTRT